jgi:O-acetyl-ADP-ribose deacetylase
MSEIVFTHRFETGQQLEITQGDLTEEQVDAIVNAANNQLAHGGGVAGAISRKGGPQIQAESSEWVRRHGPVSHDQPAYTSAGRLPARYVIHAVGPVWGAGDEDRKLEEAVRGSLETAESWNYDRWRFLRYQPGSLGFRSSERRKFSTIRSQNTIRKIHSLP